MRGVLRVFRSLPPSNPTNRPLRLWRRPVLRRPLPESRDFAPSLPFRPARGAPHSSPSHHLSYLSFLTPHSRHYDHQHQCLIPARNAQYTDWRAEGKMIRECLLSCSGGVSVSANQCKCTLQLGCYPRVPRSVESGLQPVSPHSQLCHGRPFETAAYESVPSTAGRGLNSDCDDASAVIGRSHPGTGVECHLALSRHHLALRHG